MKVLPPSRDPAQVTECQEALDGAVTELMNQAMAVGWRRDEIVTAVMEIANAWWLAQVANEKAESEIAAARRLP